MRFSTPITIEQPAFSFSYREKILLLGSCFTENIGAKLQENKFTADINPFGILYNPASIAHSLKRLLRPGKFSASDLFEHEGIYHSFAHHSRFSSDDPERSLDKMNSRLLASAANLRDTGQLIVTFGTAFVYHLKENGKLVGNCHKLPGSLFVRRMISAEEIVAEWEKLLPALWEQMPGVKVLFTISPVRHWADGAHPNQVSKATLLVATDMLQKRFPEQTAYFPSYEIMMDELRDYRFYADDMFHPSPLAVDYIWEKFAGHYLTHEAQTILKEWRELKKAIDHKLFHPDSEASKQFISQTLLKAEHLTGKFPNFDLTNEINELRAKAE